jgi:hypothetical protein
MSRTGGLAGSRSPDGGTQKKAVAGVNAGAISSRPSAPGKPVVTEIYDCSRAPEDERRAMADGKVWIESMTETLERLDKLSTVKDLRASTGSRTFLT